MGGNNGGGNVEFYNNWVTKLSQVNARHHRVFQGMKTHLPKGRPGDRALDLGCGCGHTSAVLAEYGYDVVAVDFSPELIRKAQSLYSAPMFKCADIIEYEPYGVFDVICLVDVLEHVDPRKIRALMKMIYACSAPHTKIYVNVPFGSTIEYLRQKRPELLQPIDEPYSVQEVLNLFGAYDFSPSWLELYWIQYLEAVFVKTGYLNELLKNIYGG